MGHGKTQLTHAITGKLTLTHSEELKRGITIRLGYADATIYKCNCGKYSTSKKCPYCFADTEPIRTVSFIDAPGHETLMATVLTGAALMDGAILVIAANERCPQPQTVEHLKALDIVGIKRVIVVQNKIDLVDEKRAMENYEEIKRLVENTSVANAPIIPISAQQKVNLHAVLEAIEKFIPTPQREPSKEPRMLVARSFDINKPGSEVKELVGGVLGGSIIRGKLKLGESVEIKPGAKQEGKYRTLTTKVVGLQKAKHDLEEAGPGGLLGLLTQLDPSLTKADGLVGSLVGPVNALPEPCYALTLRIEMLERVVGTKEMKEMPKLKLGERVLINVGTARSLGVVKKVKGNRVELELKIPVMVEEDQKVVLSIQIAGRWRLIGYGNVL